MSETHLDEIRGKIDAIDDHIVELLGKRFELISEISKAKKELGLEVYQSDREQKILERILKKGRSLGLNSLLLQALFLQIFAVSKRDQV